MAGFSQFRSQAVDAYEAGPRGARPVGDVGDSAGSVDTMRPRWRPAVLAALALIVVAVGGFAVRVPLGAVGVVVSAQAVTAAGQPAEGGANGPITGIALTEREPGLAEGTIVQWRTSGGAAANGTSPDPTGGPDGGSAEVVGWQTIEGTPVVLVATILDGTGAGALPGNSPAAVPPGTQVTLTFGGTSLLSDLVGWSS